MALFDWGQGISANFSHIELVDEKEETTAELKNEGVKKQKAEQLKILF